MKPVHQNQRKSELTEEVDDDEDVYMNGVKVSVSNKIAK